MRYVVAVVVAVFLLVSCGPALTGFEPGERRGRLERPEWWYAVPGGELPVVELPVRPVDPEPPVVRPVEPVEPGPPVVAPPTTPEPPVEPPVVTPEPPVPPVEPGPPVGLPAPGEDGCWTLVLPEVAAVERITKCPREPANLTRRR